MDTIRARGVRVHNLKNVDVDIARGKIIALCGLSGSGKTSLALDTLYAEGQRRYIESFSAYTRQFLERLEKPDFDSIEGLPPALAVTRGGAQRGNRSTVGTASETLDYLRVLYANVAKLSCYGCGQDIHSHSPQSVAELISQLPKRRIMLGFEVAWEDAGERSTLLADLQNQGFVRIVVAGNTFNLGDSDRQQLADAAAETDSATIIVDRLTGGDAPNRTSESLETAFDHGLGCITLYLEQAPGKSDTSLPPHSTIAIDERQWHQLSFHRQRKCLSCDITFPDPEARLFSFNSPLGACSKCEGFGDTIDLDWDLIVPDKSKSIAEGAIAPWNSPAYEHNLDELLDIAHELDLPVDVPFKKLSMRQTSLLMEGDEDLGYAGIQGFFGWLERKKYKMHVRVFLSRWRSYNTCDQCNGQRLSPEALSYKISGQSIAELCNLSVQELDELLANVDWSERDRIVAKTPLEQVRARLGYLCSVGLGYLQLSRTMRTLSGGEAQRTALTAALGSNLVNMLYVLDEPSVGLHPLDVDRLSNAIGSLAERGNTVLIVEHEDALLRKADELIELGPSAGSLGGEIVYQGPIAASKEASVTSLTLDYLNKKKHVAVAASTRDAKHSITISGCSGNNLRELTADFPLGVLCAVTGVSGSGKSSLVQDTLFPALQSRLGGKTEKLITLPYKALKGSGKIDECILVDQGPVSRSPRSNPVTYVKAFDEIRKAFAATSEAKLKNFTPGHFSFNSDLGRCPQCSGDGVLQIDMQFLADVEMTCPDCSGTRYRKEILSVRYRDQSIADVLSLSVADAFSFFRGSPKVQEKLKVLQDVGLDYLQLGQSATTLSSGESQRLKLAGFLASASKKRTLFLLDEPTTGLHFEDISQLLKCFQVLLEGGHSLIVIEHNMHLVSAADHVIDLGPGAAEQGGQIIATGTPRELSRNTASKTGEYLKEFFE